MSTPSKLSYEVGTGIIHVERSVGELSVDEYQFVPIGLSERALVSLVRVERSSGTVEPVDAYMLFNFHLGAGVRRIPEQSRRPSPGTPPAKRGWSGGPAG